MTPFIANLAGIVGGILVVGAYAYNVFAPNPNALLYNALNLVGAVFLVISLSVFFNLASFLLELVWGTIALLGVVRALIKGRAGA